MNNQSFCYPIHRPSTIDHRRATRKTKKTRRKLLPAGDDGGPDRGGIYRTGQIFILMVSSLSLGLEREMHASVAFSKETCLIAF